ncbi:helix-turn-helix domain-containing protein [Roseovarius dicentrarchi]|uniref:helix-turn-helix domain-containing protein n=1 Tax=Roseovarius dicentrarchi TaxID=2250573 RepID=UPI000DE8D0FD|nr:helix-turn-helix transcriptional regulator [Roseovarius dicentrarchi]
MGDKAIPSELVQRLHVLRAQQGMTIQQMAERCGIPKSSLESYMRLKGAKRPGVDALIAIADEMGVSIDWLVGRSADSFSTKLTQKDYALACFAVVSSLLIWVRSKQAQSESSIIDDDSFAGIPDAEIAARSMMQFVEAIQRYDKTGERVSSLRREFQAHMEKALETEETGN